MAQLFQARSFPDAATAAQSPVFLVIDHLTNEEEYAMWLAGRYFNTAELMAMGRSPFLVVEDLPHLLNNAGWDRPIVPFTRWLLTPRVDWAALIRDVTLPSGGHIDRGFVRLGPASPLEPEWIRPLFSIASRLAPEQLPRWVVRSIGLAGAHAIAAAEALGLVVQDGGLEDEWDALADHPDLYVRAIAEDRSRRA